MERFLEWSVESSVKTFVDMNKDLISRLKEFMENEARSGSMDFGCITPEYVYSIWGGTVAIEDIAEALAVYKKELLDEC